MILLTVAVILTVILIGLVYKLLGTQIEELSNQLDGINKAVHSNSDKLGHVLSEIKGGLKKGGKR